MTKVQQLFETAVTVTITLASLANAAGRAGTAITNSNNDIASDIFVQIKTGAAGVSSTGYFGVYLLRSPNGINWDDNFGGIDANWTPVEAILLRNFTANANATSYYATLDTQEANLTLPQKYAIGIYNGTGAALDATAANFSVIVVAKQLQSA